MKEILSFILIICLVVEEISALSIPTDVHTYCSKDTCPQYRLVHRIRNLELRCYKPSIWVSVSGKGKLFVDDHKLPMWKLHQFFNGNNTKAVQVPVGTLTSRVFDESRRTFSAEYYVPSFFWKKVPREVDPSVRVIYRRSFCAYVYGFPGWIHSFESMSFVRSEAKRMIAKYGNRNLYYPKFFFYVNYKSSSLHLPEYNEIWYIIEFSGVDSEKSVAGNS